MLVVGGISCDGVEVGDVIVFFCWGDYGGGDG